MCFINEPPISEAGRGGQNWRGQDQCAGLSKSEQTGPARFDIVRAERSGFRLSRGGKRSQAASVPILFCFRHLQALTLASRFSYRRKVRGRSVPLRFLRAVIQSTGARHMKFTTDDHPPHQLARAFCCSSRSRLFCCLCRRPRRSRWLTHRYRQGRNGCRYSGALVRITSTVLIGRPRSLITKPDEQSRFLALPPAPMSSTSRSRATSPWSEEVYIGAGDSSKCLLSWWTPAPGYELEVWRSRLVNAEGSRVKGITTRDDLDTIPMRRVSSSTYSRPRRGFRRSRPEAPSLSCPPSVRAWTRTNISSTG